MVTWKLWQSLHAAENHYVRYWRHVMNSRQRMQDSYSFRPTAWVTWSAALLILLIFSGVWVFMVPFLPLIVLSSGTIYGVLAAMQISSLITYEQTRNRYDLASLLPMGSAGVHWTISRITVQNMTGMAQARYALFGLCFITILGVTGFLVFGGLSLVEYLSLGMILLALYIDFMQSVIVGVLTGMTVATFTRDRLSANALGMLLFLLLQVLFYLLVMIICFVMLPSVINAFTGGGEFALNLLRLLCLLAIREAMLLLVLRWSAARMNSNTLELNYFISAP